MPGRVLLIYIIALFTIQADYFKVDIRPSSLKSNIVGKIKIIDCVELVYGEIDGIDFEEISDLAYSNGNLYLISDKGVLSHFRATFDKNIDLKPIHSYKLHTKKGKFFTKKRDKDSEGLCIDDKNRLYASFERRAKVVELDTKGTVIKKLKLPSLLGNKKSYRGKNKQLESILYHPKYGLMIASEYPLRKSNRFIQTIYSLNGRNKFSFKTPHIKNIAITAIESMDSGDILILLRAYNGTVESFTTILAKLDISSCKNGMCNLNILVQLSRSDGWLVDNFEGLTRVGKNRYAIISDDGGHFYQRTLMLYFEVIE